MEQLTVKFKHKIKFVGIYEGEEYKMALKFESKREPKFNQFRRAIENFFATSMPGIKIYIKEIETLK